MPSPRPATLDPALLAAAVIIGGPVPRAASHTSASSPPKRRDVAGLGPCGVLTHFKAVWS